MHLGSRSKTRSFLLSLLPFSAHRHTIESIFEFLARTRKRARSPREKGRGRKGEGGKEKERPKLDFQGGY